MHDEIAEAITRLIRYQRAPESVTRELRGMQHNRDILPTLQRQVETVLQAHRKFQPIVYDTQGFLDDGSDIVLRYDHSGGEYSPRLIGFQVKSFDDLNKKNYMQELKAQRDDSFRKVEGLNQYYIMLCTDSLTHKDKVRKIAAEFRSATRTEVIEPVYAITFLRHPKTRIEALVKRLFEADDVVFRSALDLIEFPSPSAKALALYLVIKSIRSGSSCFEVQELFQSAALRKIYDSLRNELTESFGGSPASVPESDTQLAEDLALLDTDIVDLESDTVTLRFHRSVALTAVVADAVARYEYDEDQLFDYMINLMGLME